MNPLKKGTLFFVWGLIAGLGLVLGVTLAWASQVSVPSAPGANYFLVSTSTGAYIATSTPFFPLGFSSAGTSTLATTTTASLNGMIIVDGVHYAQTGAGVLSAVATCKLMLGLLGQCGGVYAPPGTYTFSSAITVFSGLHLLGSGASTTIFKLANSANSDLVTSPSTGLDEVRISGITFDGNGTNQTGIGGGSALIDLEGHDILLRNIFLDHIVVHDSYATNVFFTGENNTNYSAKGIEYSRVYNAGQGTVGFGIYADYAPNTTFAYNYINNPNGDDDIEIGHLGKVLAIGNQVHGGQLQFPFGSDSTIQDNWVYDNTIQNDNNIADNMIIIGNHVLNATPTAGFGGISVNGSSSTISGNIVLVNANSGIRTFGSGNTVSGNTINSTVQNGNGVYADHGSFNDINTNTISGFARGIELVFDGNNVQGNIIASSTTGVDFSDSSSSGHVMKGNYVAGNTMLSDVGTPYNLHNQTGDSNTVISIAAGNTGIGTTTPYARFSVSVSSSTPPFAVNQAGTGHVADFFANGSLALSINSTGSTTLGKFGTCSGTTALTTDSSGAIICGTITGTGGSTFPFTPLSWGNATGTTIGFTNGIITNASSTFNGGSVFDNSTTTNATTTSLKTSNFTLGSNALITSLTGSGLSISGGALGLTNTSVTVNTNAPLSGGGAVSLGGSLTLTCPSCNIDGTSWLISNSALIPTTTLGVVISASSTIGNGTQAGGLTINGGATSSTFVVTSTSFPQLTIKYPGTTACTLGETVNGFGDFAGCNLGVAEAIPNSKLAISGGVAIGNQAIFSEATAPTGGLIVQGRTGIGSSSPFATLAIHALNNTTNQTLFAIGSSTSGATTTLFSINNIGTIFTQLSDGCVQASGGNLTSTGSGCGTGTGGSGAATSSFAATFPVQLTTSASSITYSSAFGTTTNTGLPVNQLVYTSNTGVLVTAASSSLSLPNTALQNSSVTVNTSAPLAGGGAVSLGGSLSLTCATCNTDGTSWKVFNTALAPTTTLGILVSASSTIGDGTQTGGLVINGGATTTKIAYFASKVGIGTQAPVRSLDVVGNVVGDFIGIKVFNTSTNINDNASIELDPANLTTARAKISAIAPGGSSAELGLYTSNANNSPLERLRIDHFGNVGIATTGPIARLTVQANSTDSSIPQFLFLVSSSTAAFATTTLFSVSNTGSTTIGNFGGCSGTSALTTNAGGTIVCGSGYGSVTSVGLSSGDSSLSIGGTPVTTSGTLTAALNLAHGNTWTGLQQFNGGASSTGEITAATASSTTLLISGTPTCNASNRALQTDTSGLVNCGTITASAAAGGSNGQWQYNNSTAIAGMANSDFALTQGAASFGTSTPALNNLFTLGSSTAAQLTLVDNSLTSNQWNFRSINSWLYVATSSPGTGATSTVAALTVDPNGNVTLAHNLVFPALAAASGLNCLKIDTSGNVSSAACGGGGRSTSASFEIPFSDCAAAATSTRFFAGGSFFEPAVIPSTSSAFTPVAMAFGYATSSEMDCSVHVPSDYSSGLTLKIEGIVSTSTSGVGVVDVEATDTPKQAGQWGTPIWGASSMIWPASTTAADRITIPGTAGVGTSTSVSMTGVPNLTAGDDILIRFTRWGKDAADTAGADVLFEKLYLTYTSQ